MNGRVQYITIRFYRKVKRP